MNICLIQTYLPTVINFRGFLLDQLVEDGDNVWVLCPTDNSQKYYEKILIDKGVNFIPLNMDRKSMNFFKELYLLTQIFYRLKKIDYLSFLWYQALELYLMRKEAILRI